MLRPLPYGRGSSSGRTLYIFLLRSYRTLFSGRKHLRSGFQPVAVPARSVLVLPSKFHLKYATSHSSSSVNVDHTRVAWYSSGLRTQEDNLFSNSCCPYKCSSRSEAILVVAEETFYHTVRNESRPRASVCFRSNTGSFSHLAPFLGLYRPWNLLFVFIMISSIYVLLDVTRTSSEIWRFSADTVSPITLISHPVSLPFWERSGIWIRRVWRPSAAILQCPPFTVRRDNIIKPVQDYSSPRWRVVPSALARDLQKNIITK